VDDKLGPDDYASILHANEQDRSAALKTLSPDEFSEYVQFANRADQMGGQQGNDIGISPMMTGLMGLGGMAAKSIPAVRHAVSEAWPYAKAGGIAYGIGKLPIPDAAKTALEVLFGMKTFGKGGLGEAAAEGEAITGAGETALRMPKSKPSFDDISQRAQGGGGIAFEHGGEVVRPNGPISQRRMPIATPTEDPSNMMREGTSMADETDKRRIMFGGAGEGIDGPKASDRGPIKKATLRKPKN
jgi:hypothetical protein